MEIVQPIWTRSSVRLQTIWSREWSCRKTLTSFRRKLKRGTAISVETDNLEEYWCILSVIKSPVCVVIADVRDMDSRRDGNRQELFCTSV